jgi:hypothetical protein
MTEREELLDRAGMTGFKDPVPVLAELDAVLQTRFEDTNRAIAADLNPHFKLLTGKSFRISPRNRMRKKASHCATSSRSGTTCR